MDGSTTAYAFEVDGVRHVSALYAIDARQMRARSRAGKPADEPVPCWVHIAKLGDYEGHPAGGFSFTPEAFAQILKNFEARETPLNVDYEHQTFNRALKGDIPSAGWIDELELREDGSELWALVQMLPDAAAKVRSRQLRSCSPVVVPEAQDRVTGEDIGFELRSLALTNDPFLDGLRPLTLTLTRGMSMTDEEKKKAEDEAAKKATEAAAGAEKTLAEDPPAPDATSLLEAIAASSGADVDTVLAWLLENVDKLASGVQEAIEKGGTAAENRALRAMTITIGPGSILKFDDKKMQTALKTRDAQIRLLSERVAAAEATVAQLETNAKTEAEALAKAAADAAEVELLAKVKLLQEQGFVGKEQQDFDDAVLLFREQPDVAARLYAVKKPPVGTIAGDDPVAKSGAGGVPLLMSQLTDGQRAAFEALRGMGKSEKDALAFIAKRAERAASN
jgi:hypothetical protein